MSSEVSTLWETHQYVCIKINQAAPNSPNTQRIRAHVPADIAREPLHYCNPRMSCSRCTRSLQWCLSTVRGEPPLWIAWPLFIIRFPPLFEETQGPSAIIRQRSAAACKTTETPYSLQLRLAERVELRGCGVYCFSTNRLHSSRSLKSCGI